MSLSQPPITPEQLQALPPEIQSLIIAIIDHYEQRIAKLEAELAAFKKTPRNSSLPPSTEHPHAKPPKDKKKSKKKRGGQPGHPKHERPLIPTEKCSKVVALYPDSCRRCAAELTGEDADPLRHQVWELPQFEPDVTEYQRHRRKCQCCGETTCALLPEGVPTGQSGPRLVALVGLLMGHFRQSKRRAAFFLQDFLGMPCCPSLTVKMENQVAAALEQPYEELRQALADEKQLNMDESPTKQGNQKAWLWTAVAAKYAVFAIFSSRKATKLSFGTQSASGSRFIERMLTVSETCRLQGRSIFSYLTAAVDAHFQGRPTASLLPGA